jgi:hypothetical protein
VGAFPNTDYPFDYLPVPKWSFFGAASNPSFAIPGNLSYRVFDTWSRAPGVLPNQYSTWNTAGSVVSIPLKIRIKALQIRIRVWDRKSEQARQITIVQDM